MAYAISRLTAESDFSQCFDSHMLQQQSPDQEQTHVVAPGATIYDDVTRLPIYDGEPWREAFNATKTTHKNGTNTAVSQLAGIDTSLLLSSPNSNASSPTNIFVPELLDVHKALDSEPLNQNQFRQLDSITEQYIIPGSLDFTSPAIKLEFDSQARQQYEANSQFDHASLFRKLGKPLSTPQVQFNVFSQFFVSPADNESFLSVNPDDVTLKRKVFESELTNGREIKRRDVTSSFGDFTHGVQPPLLSQQLVSPVTDSGNVVFNSELHPKEGSDATHNSKVSTTRPKSVVPEKFLNDGSAELALGMSVTKIQSFPTFEELLKHVQPCHYSHAKSFGEKIARNRIKAKNAAKRSRDQRRAKIERVEDLEKRIEELKMQVKGMKLLLGRLVDSGAINEDVVQAYL
ncbi:hypothetical protein CNBC5680 [Cryptococcus deneoformans B-3501A]|uniref:BZIP domain-containing protein n=1 Tax=Cryptococcus deneoformans (strain JEC21 / ATCC MYA-565) TaxID=214684 RepID=Q5KKW9_CRYD1|nr:hypothetical protein CNC01580 [Cryptococcus neoformans var. neoformans JEC21]XP_776351.1 hypothetical protein CNBC5680 [Cryptococcus neoformans var. neoformans B-3501A]AAW42191.1 hypothetical protein CNC01580 [Cryptococcus neoformans var. neoformans JEC21]EAL21704.1 hypothetical protein CNBC5680 [Cryptococcus neoformans var. neoformans B-3501A]